MKWSCLVDVWLVACVLSDLRTQHRHRRVFSTSVLLKVTEEETAVVDVVTWSVVVNDLLVTR